MGEHDVRGHVSEEDLRKFTSALLDDVRAMERMLDEERFETGARRIGAEQEMFLVNDAFRPSGAAMQALELIGDDAFTTELAKFNLEANLPVYEFGGTCLSDIESKLRSLLEGALERLEPIGVKILLTGILPSLRLSDLGLDNMAPIPRYFELNDAMVRLRGGEFRARIKGIDELFATHDNVMLEACNTSFQLHWQVAADEFAPHYNIAQLVTGPCLAPAANSVFLLGKRLWHETRVALFQQSVDARSAALKIRGGPPRVHFGDRWVDDSVLELIRADVARFRSVLGLETGESALDVLDRGGIPDLSAFRLHNGTIYRWNRPCYGVHDGKAHLRIENRTLPAGPTILDEMANAALFFGLMAAGPDHYGDMRSRIDFGEVKANFVAAARLGLKAQFSWLDGKSYSAADLLVGELIPLAREGLAQHDVSRTDADRYLGVLEERVTSGRTGAQWALDSFTRLGDVATGDERMRALTAATHKRQITSNPVHEWDLAGADEAPDWRHSYETVGQFMTTDLFTVRPGDLVDLAANVMDWERVRHVPVENDDGTLVGLVTHRTLMRLLAQGYGKRMTGPVAIESVMKRDPISVAPDTRTIDAIRLMREKRVGCLPIVLRGRLVGLITERDLVDVSAALLEQNLREALEG